MHSFTNKLLDWYDTFGRKNLPWQQDITPYRVWISEIMLQQTQVTTVIPYFERFISRFPTIHSLATAKLDEVLHLWTGLGYYARARNLHRTAIIIDGKFNGLFPNNLDDLLVLPGIGRSTAGAILSIAFQKATPILDGNVKRVLTRHYAIAGYLSDKNVNKELWLLAQELTPEIRCGAYTQAIMDLGATVCLRLKPKCKQCPLNETCIAYLENRIVDFPQAKSKRVLPIKEMSWLVLQNEKLEVLLVKRPFTGIWGGLWSFPECEERNMASYCDKKGYKIISIRKGDTFRHTFSHFHMDITPLFVTVNIKYKVLTENDEIFWCSPNRLPQIGLAAPIKKILLLIGVNDSLPHSKQSEGSPAEGLNI
jgi:A/G-specific adenine glycosylase